MYHLATQYVVCSITIQITEEAKTVVMVTYCIISKQQLLNVKQKAKNKVR